MWEQTVTVYHPEGDTIQRRVLTGCHYTWRLEDVTDEWGRRQETKFLLVAPGKAQISPGDRVCEGEGPQISASDWAAFIPVNVPGLAEVAYVRPCRWNEHICHTEAGRK